MDLIEVDSRRRITLPKSANHQHYLLTVAPDGTLTLTPAVVRSALEDAIRAQQPGYLEELDRNARDASRTVEFVDWENPTAGRRQSK